MRGIKISYSQSGKLDPVEFRFTITKPMFISSIFGSWDLVWRIELADTILPLKQVLKG